MKMLSGYIRGLIALTLWCGANLSATTIVINNPSFEADELQTGVYINSSPIGWDDIPQITSGVWNTGPGTPYFNSSAPDGNAILFLGYGAPGEASQTLSAALAANTVYTLTYYVGARNDVFFSQYTVALTANGSTLASDSGGNPTPGDFVLRTFSFTAGANPADAGSLLGIDVFTTGRTGGDSDAGGQAEFDAFSLTAVPGTQSAAPEPTTLSLIGGAMTVAAIWSRRRRLLVRL